MKIVEIVHGFPPELSSGTERVVEAMARGLLRRGHDVVVVAGSREKRPAPVVEDSESEGLRVRRVYRDDLFHALWWKSRHPAITRIVAAILAEERPDVCHVHHWIHLSRDLVRTAAEIGVPSVVTLHDLSLSCLLAFRAPGDGTAVCQEPFSAATCLPCAARHVEVPVPDGEDPFASLAADFRGELAAARAVTVVSEAQRRVLIGRGGIDVRSATVLPLGLLEPLAAAPVPAGLPPLRLVSFGVHVPAKGTHVLLEALRLAGPGIELDILGRIDLENYRMRLLDLARGLPVRFHGPYAPRELSSLPAHIAVLPSLCFETFGLTLDEAHALGHPAVVADRGAPAGRAGPSDIVVPAGDAAALGSILRRLRDDPAEVARRRMLVPRPAGIDGAVEEAERLLLAAAAAGPPDRAALAHHPVRRGDDEAFAEREERFRRRIEGRAE